ncbi:MAG: hypothetical protein ACK4FS_01005 [Flavobacterium sp.]
MMLFNISYNDKKTNQSIEALVGRPFGLIDNIKLNGVGSPRLDILKTSQEIGELLSYDHNRNFCNIELRPKGIIIRFRSLLETYGLIVPYHKLIVFKPGNSFTFHCDHHFITVEAPPNNKAVNSFIEKVLQQKTENTPTFIDDL